MDNCVRRIKLYLRIYKLSHHALIKQPMHHDQLHNNLIAFVYYFSRCFSSIINSGRITAGAIYFATRPFVTLDYRSSLIRTNWDAKIVRIEGKSSPTWLGD